MALNLAKLDRAVTDELERLQQIIALRIGSILQSSDDVTQTISLRIARSFYKWKRETNNGESAARYQFLDIWPKHFAEPAEKDALQIREGISHIENMQNSFALMLKHRLEANGYSVDHLNEMLTIVDDTMAEIAADSRQNYETWKKSVPGNRPKPQHYLRLAIDGCLEDLSLARNRRARIVAAAEVAVGVVSADKEDDERNSVNYLLGKQ